MKEPDTGDRNGRCRGDTGFGEPEHEMLNCISAILAVAKAGRHDDRCRAGTDRVEECSCGLAPLNDGVVHISSANRSERRTKNRKPTANTSTDQTTM